jgi:hypothetical protein
MSKDTLHLDSFFHGHAIGVSNLTHLLRTMIDQGWTTAELKKYLDAKQVETNAVIDAQRMKETRPPRIARTEEQINCLHQRVDIPGCAFGETCLDCGLYLP